ncbi:restriction endonuclease subunit S [Campylobacter jejuni]|nr:restriction endonuclease subunit S [Campylobacter jejuni]EHY7560946.1 restriction endonuclease subunit S [Campylobacter jejuni]EKE4174210.1 restriction endonuclease subunit S [Campylobacter jejuni]
MKNFKDSGIEWLGEIPQHWEVVKIKFLAIFYTGDSIKDSEKHKYCFLNNSIPYISTKDIDINTNVIDYNNGMFIEKNDANFKRAYTNSILLCLEGANAGKKIAFLDKEVCFVNKLCCISSKTKKLNSKFLFYFLQSVFFKNVFIANIKGLIGGITTDQLGNFYMLFPPLKEQEQIANFLDEKCKKIANFTEKKEKLITLLKEQKQALINETITKGLDKNVNFKDSDIEWLGEIPQHWNILKLKHIASLRNQKSNNIDFRIGLENIESKTGKFIPSSEVVFEEDGIGFKKGDILFGKLRPYLAKVFLTDRDGICVSEFLVLKIKSESNKFIKFLMLSSLFIDIVDSSTYGTKMPRANWEFIGNLKIPLPPLKEQEQIANFLDEKCEKIDLLIEKTKKQIKLIKEYKTILINQAVCGRISL